MASGNPGKLREMARILAEFDLTVVPQAEFSIVEAEETGTTFVENALIKARHAAQATGLPAIADDSGLAVDALQGRPGVYSARYAGESASDDDNIEKLLSEMRSVDEPERGATFHCVACFVTPAVAEPLIAKGEWRGSIARQRQGEHGFGYDPVFVDAELGVCAAELTADQKNQRSHRGKALAELSKLLRQQ